MPVKLTKHLLTMLCGVLSFLSLTTSCGDKDPEFISAKDSFGISDVLAQPRNGVNSRTPLKIRGYGFTETDRVILVGEDATEYATETCGVAEDHIEVLVPRDVEAGTYVGRLERADGRKLMLGHIEIYWILDTDVPDKPGMTLKGTVSCENKGVAGVAVSDGYEITVTDENGFYWLPSQKTNGQVFISLPSGYFVDTKVGMPAIWQSLKEPADVVEQHDFALTKMPGDDYVLMLMADVHLANRGSGSNNDMNQFRDKYVPDINNHIAEYKAQGKKVIGIALGDLTWDSYWYDKNYKLPDVKKDIERINIPVFCCMGNHDNDIRAITDFEASAPWREYIGPNYYSFNLGQVHYVVLDDIIYTTDGQEHKTETGGVTPEQMEWLRKDLALITDKSTPIVVCMHIPLNAHPGREESGAIITRHQLQNSYEFVEAFKGFSKVRILSGHTHVNFNVPVNDNIFEHNIGGACATWWWTGKYYGTHICRDGSVGGYGVMEWNGRDYTRYWKCLGYDKSYQFRTYDRNNVWITKEEYAPDQDHTDTEFIKNYNFLAQDYAWQHTNNEVIVNIFSWEDSWKLEILEDGEPLKWGVTNWFDPLHIISFDMFRLNKNNENLQGSALKTAATSHLFRCYPKSATSTLKITVTDNYGNVYTETMTRPKSFNVNTQ